MKREFNIENRKISNNDGVTSLVQMICKKYQFINEEEISNTEDIIFINMMLVWPQFYWMFPKLILAKSLQKDLKCKIVAIDYQTSESLKSFYSLWGVETVDLYELRKNNTIGVFKALYKSIFLILFGKTVRKLVDFTYDSVNIGKHIFDNIIRSSMGKEESKKKYTIEKLTINEHLAKIVSGIWTADSLNKFWKKFHDTHLIMDVYAFDEAIVTKYAIINNVKVYKCSPRDWYRLNISEEDILNDSDICALGINRLFSSLSESDEYYREQVENYFGKRKVGGRVRKTISREELNDRLGLNPDKKNVLIMCNCYSDLSHGMSKDFIFTDYYQASDYTIRTVSKMNNVNWIIKSHPYHKIYYQEPNITKMLFEKYKSDNIYFVPEEMEGFDFSKSIDALITTVGSGTLEYGAYGIPSIMMAKTEYVELGEFNVAKSIEDYNNMLCKIQNLPPYSEHQINTISKILFVYSYGHGEVGTQNEKKTDVEKLLIENEEEYLEVANKYFNSDRCLDYIFSNVSYGE